MSQVIEFPDRDDPVHDDFLYLVTQGNTDYKILLSALMGETTVSVIEPFYELLLADQYRTIRMSFNGDKELTVPLNFDVPYAEGTVIIVRNASAFLITLVPSTVDVILNTKSGLKIIARGEAKLVYVGNNTWDVIGDLSA